jgi:glycosyltransferase involved in cell wall biosynthesis
MKTPLLSICIAPHNRADYIGETLESIIPQVTEFLSELLKRPSWKGMLVVERGRWK